MRRQLAALVFALVLPLPTLAAEVVIQPGETLSEIAARAGISTQRLMQLNGLRDADRIVAGQRLTVPGAPQRAGGGQREAASAGGRITVRQGETLSEIAEHHGVSVERLMQWNGITDPTRLVAGDRLIVRAPLSNRQEGSGGGAGRGGGTTVTVRPGDTLSDIADRYNVPLERLIQLNRVQNPSQVMAGEKLLISTRPPTRPQRPGPSGQTSAGARVHVVQPGETLSDIATDYQVPMERLVSLNRLKDPDELLAGTELRLIPPPPVPRSTPRTTPRPKPGGKAPTVARSTPTRPTTTTAPARSDATTATATAVTRRTAPTTVAGTASSPT
ncbi:MAG: LysM peptidoglycan-binding domain-containing protein, partial [Cyanobacteriota bacterium]